MDESIESMKFIGSLGLGGVLAWGMFLVYRKDSLVWQESWKGQQQLLVQVVKENTAAITALITKLDGPLNHQQRADETPRGR